MDQSSSCCPLLAVRLVWGEAAAQRGLRRGPSDSSYVKGEAKEATASFPMLFEVAQLTAIIGVRLSRFVFDDQFRSCTRSPVLVGIEGGVAEPRWVHDYHVYPRRRRPRRCIFPDARAPQGLDRHLEILCASLDDVLCIVEVVGNGIPIGILQVSQPLRREVVA
eukprot:1820603-Pyramimonas_sp.AAC.1